MTPRFRACLAETLRWEGGWSDHPLDPGGATMRGITLARYAAHMGAPIDAVSEPFLKQELRAISDEMVAEVYHTYYWRPIRGDDLPVGVDMALFDYAVNSGPVQAIKVLQRALGITADGHMGPVTVAAARAADPVRLLPHFLSLRRQFLKALRTFGTFGRGWIRRVDGLEHRVMADVSALGSLPSPKQARIGAWNTSIAPSVSTCRSATGQPKGPLTDPDAQSETQGRASEPQPSSMAASSTGQAATVGGAMGSGQIGVEVASAAARSRGGDGAFDVMGFALALAQSPTFWLAVGMVASAAYVWLERRRKMILT